MRCPRTNPGCDAVGRTPGQAPEVDGRTFLAGASTFRPGDIVPAEVVNADEFDLFARVICA